PSQVEKAIPEVFRSVAESKSTLDGVALRISCRSAEWPAALEAELRSIFGDQNVRTYELERLRETDVARAATQLFSIDLKQRFLDSVRQHEAEPLASRPITLNMLLSVFQVEAELPRQQIQLYRKGLLASIEEANATRRSNRQTWHLDLRSKLMVAAR